MKAYIILILVAGSFVSTCGCAPPCLPGELESERHALPGFGTMLVLRAPVLEEVGFSYGSRGVLGENGEVVLHPATAVSGFGFGFVGCAPPILVRDGIAEPLRKPPQLTAFASAMKDEGTIVGSFSPATPLQLLFQRDQRATLLQFLMGVSGDVIDRPIVWRDGAPLALPTIDDRSGHASAINERAQIFGTVYTRPWQVVRWDEVDGAWHVTALFEFGEGGYGSVEAANDRGDVTGDIEVGIPYLWRDGVLTRLPTLGGPETPYTSAADINNAGWATGTLSYPDLDVGQPGLTRAVLWRDGSVFDLSALRSDVSSRARAINDAGQVVGSSLGRAFLWQNGAMRDLNELIPQELGITLIEAVDINNIGGILAITADDVFVLLDPFRPE